MNTIKDGDFLVKMEVTDQYGNTSTSDARPIRLDRYGPQVGLYGPDLSAVADGEVVFFPERLTVASYNGYTGGVVETKATLGGVELPLSPRTLRVCSPLAKPTSALTSGESYPLIVTARTRPIGSPPRPTRSAMPRPRLASHRLRPTLYSLCSGCP